MTCIICTMRIWYWHKFFWQINTFNKFGSFFNANVEYVSNTAPTYCCVRYTFHFLPVLKLINRSILEIYLSYFLCNTSYKYFVCDSDIFFCVNLQVLIMHIHNANITMLLSMHQLDNSSKLMTHHTVTGGLYSLLTT